MFKLQPNPTFKQKASIHVPGQKPAEIEIEFRYLTRKEAASYFESLRDKTDLDALAEIIVGWSGVDQPFARDALDLLLNNYLTAGQALFAAFTEGLTQAKQKN